MSLIPFPSASAPASPTPASAPTTWQEALSSSFSEEARATVMRQTHPNHIVDAIEAAAKKEPEAIIAFDAAVADTDWFTPSHRARIAHVAGNALALTDVEAALRAHERGCALLVADGKGQTAEMSYGLARRVHRLVALDRLDDAIDVAGALRALPSCSTDGWVRNRYWEACVITGKRLVHDAHLRLDDGRSLCTTALTLTTFLPTAYTFTARLELMNVIALAARKAKDFDAAHAMCLRVMAFASSDLDDAPKEEVSWGILEGAFVGFLRQRPDDIVVFADGIAALGPLHDNDVHYTTVLRAEACVMQQKFDEAAALLARVRRVEEQWIEVAHEGALMRLANARGDVDGARRIAEGIIDRFSEVHSCADEVVRARVVLSL
jgi:hypothetical protein